MRPNKLAMCACNRLAVHLISCISVAGVVLPLLQQSVMFFNIAFSRLVLRKELAWQQYVGAAAVVAGVCFAALPEDGGTSIFAGVCNMFAMYRRVTCGMAGQEAHLGMGLLADLHVAMSRPC